MGVYRHVEASCRERVTAAQMAFVLRSLKEYLLFSEQNTINDTAFMDEVSYIHRSARIAGKKIPKYIIRAIIRAERRAQGLPASNRAMFRRLKTNA